MSDSTDTLIRRKGYLFGFLAWLGARVKHPCISGSRRRIIAEGVFNDIMWVGAGVCVSYERITTLKEYRYYESSRRMILNIWSIHELEILIFTVSKLNSLSGKAH